MATTQETKAGRPPVYPWNVWLKPNSTTTLTKGKDFYCEVQSLVLLARRHAKNRGVRVGVSVRELAVTLAVKE